MSHKVQGYPGATGYWGPRISCRIAQSAIPGQILALTLDELFAMGRRAALWLPVRDDTAGAVPCTCEKVATQRSDARCLTCFGTKFAPGYLKFAHETRFWCSAEFALFTLVNTEIDRSVKPNRIRLTSGALTGTIVTQDKPYTNTAPIVTAWTYDLAAFRKVASDTLGLEFSTTAGATWFDISSINDPVNGAVAPSGTLRFRITLGRAALTTTSPDFEIVRLRRAQPEVRPNLVRQQRPDMLPGEILVLRTWEQERVARAIAAGRQVDLDADEAWTVPLDTFSTAIAMNTAAARVDDRQAGGHPFYEQLDGMHAGQRDVITQVKFDENFLDLFTRQVFTTRRAQAPDASGAAQWANTGEMYHLVW